MLCELASCVEQVHQRDLGAVQLPVAGEDAAVLVAVAVAQHDVLLGAGALHQLRDAGQGVELAHDGRGVAQVVDGLEQRHDDQVGHRLVVQRAVQQAHFLLQQQHFQQVAHRLGVADDVVADRLRAEALAHAASRSRRSRAPRAACAEYAAPITRSGRASDSSLQQQRAPRRPPRQLRVVRLDARHRQQFGRPRPRAGPSFAAGPPSRGGSRTLPPRGSADAGAAAPAPRRGAPAASRSMVRRSARNSSARR